MATYSNVRAPYAHTERYLAKKAAQDGPGREIPPARTDEHPEKSYSQTFIDNLCGPGSYFPSGRSYFGFRG
jgi:hypothetical protein